MVNPTKLLFFRFLLAAHAQENLVPTSVAARIRVFMEETARCCAIIPNTSLNAPAQGNTSVDHVRSGENDPVRNYLKCTRKPGLGCLFHPTDHSIYKTFCDFKSENNSVWTLVESFSMANNPEFVNKPFYVDYPVNKKGFSWNKFRLPLSHPDGHDCQSFHSLSSHMQF